MTYQDAVGHVLKCLTEVLNEDGQPIPAELGETFELMGSTSGLDSIKLVELIADLEQTLEEQLGIKIPLADERALSQAESPFRSVSTLAGYISLLVEERQSSV